MRVDELLKQVQKNHPEQAELIAAFTPLALAQEQLRQCTSKTKISPWDTASMPIASAKALNAAQILSEALASGFAANAQDFQNAHKALSHKPSPLKTLCKSWLNNDKEVLAAFAKRHSISPEPLSMLILQVVRAIATYNAQRTRVNAIPESTPSTCPCCGSAPDMSIIFEKEGVRYLHCSLCSHTWRYARTACPFCATDTAENLVWLYEENRKEERAVKCSHCHKYILEIDARPLQIDSPALAYYASLGMNHLDALAQE